MAKPTLKLEYDFRSRPRKVRHNKIKIRMPSDLLPYLEGLRHSEQEVVSVFLLDGNNQIISSHIVTVGLANQANIHPREVFKWSVRNSACAIMLVHNHPSGNTDASESDLIATRRMAEAGKILGILLLDHMIISPDSYLSIREKYPNYFT